MWRRSPRFAAGAAIVRGMFRALLFFLALACACTAHAGSYRIGATSIELPAPPGFEDPTADVPGLKRFGETITPPSNRLLAMFLSSADAKTARAGSGPEMRRYFLVQTYRQAESKSIPVGEFAGLKKLLKNQFEALLAQAASAAGDHLASVERKLGERVRVGEMRAIEIFDEHDTAISMLALTTYQVGGREVPMAFATTTAVLGGKLVYMYAYSVNRGSADLDWVRASARAWLRAARAAN